MEANEVCRPSEIIEKSDSIFENGARFNRSKYLVLDRARVLQYGVFSATLLLVLLSAIFYYVLQVVSATMVVSMCPSTLQYDTQRTCLTLTNYQLVPDARYKVLVLHTTLYLYWNTRSTMRARGQSYSATNDTLVFERSG
jgi:hypothetical protein